MVTAHSRKSPAARKPRLKTGHRPTLTPLSTALSTELRAMVHELELIRSTTAVAAALLDAQAADLDTDIGHVLRRSVSDRLHAMVERTARMLAAVHEAKPARQVH